MESTITQKKGTTTVEKFNDCTERWCKEKVLNLAHHFHVWDKTDGQQRRVNYFALENVASFNMIKEIKEIKVCLALEKAKRKKVTFCPYLKINDSNDLIFDLKPIVFQGLGAPVPSLVPNSFKEMICKNWDELGIHLIDDLFHCKDEEGFPVAMKRVRHFQIGSIQDPEVDNQLIKHINDHCGHINKLTLYPGVDMNKVQYNTMISFTPVIGIATNRNENEENESSRMGVIESVIGGNEFLYEYLRPCPPTCQQ